MSLGWSLWVLWRLLNPPWNHRVQQWVGLERTWKLMEHLPPAQIALSPVQPGLENLWLIQVGFEFSLVSDPAQILAEEGWSHLSFLFLPSLGGIWQCCPAALPSWEKLQRLL